MKKLGLATALLLAMTGAHAYQVEVQGQSEFLDATVNDKDFTGAAQGTVYLKNVDASKGPLAEAAFLNQASNVSAAYSFAKLSGNEIPTIKNNSFGVKGEAYLPTPYLPIYTSASYSHSQTKAEDEKDNGDRYALEVGALVAPNFLVAVGYTRVSDQISLDAKLKRFKSLLPNIDIVILSDYGKGALEQVSAMIELANASKKLVLVDPKGDAYDKYKGATVLTPNRSELRQVVGQWSSEDDLTLRAQSLRKNLGLGALLLTRSEEGMTLFTDKGTEHVRAQAREVFDVSGAGDTVIAALAVAMGAGWSLERAMALANRAGGIVVGKLGTATVSAEELQ